MFDRIIMEYAKMIAHEIAERKYPGKRLQYEGKINDLAKRYTGPVAIVLFTVFALICFGIIALIWWL